MTRTALAIALASIVGLPLAAEAQQGAPTPPPQNRLQVERVKSGFVIAPDVRFGKINDRDARSCSAEDRRTDSYPSILWSARTPALIDSSHVAMHPTATVAKHPTIRMACSVDSGRRRVRCHR